MSFHRSLFISPAPLILSKPEITPLLIAIKPSRSFLYIMSLAASVISLGTPVSKSNVLANFCNAPGYLAAIVFTFSPPRVLNANQIFLISGNVNFLVGLRRAAFKFFSAANIVIRSGDCSATTNLSVTLLIRSSNLSKCLDIDIPTIYL